jgi:hypothetical protein
MDSYLKTKNFVVLLLCIVIAVSSVFIAYQLGSSGGFNDGYSAGYVRGQASGNLASGHAYQAGYDAGLKAQNQTGP